MEIDTSTSVCVFFFVVAVIGFLLRSQRNVRLSIKYRYRIYALRDDLRLKAIEGRISPHSWVFDYLDSSFSKIIGQLGTLSIYKVGILAILHRRDKRLQEFRKKISTELKKNEEFRELYNQYGNLLFEFFVERHKTTKICFTSIISFFRAASKIRASLESLILASRDLPETADYRFQS